MQLTFACGACDGPLRAPRTSASAYNFSALAKDQPSWLGARAPLRSSLRCTRCLLTRARIISVCRECGGGSGRGGETSASAGMHVIE
jgi:hypothetical protein